MLYLDCRLSCRWIHNPTAPCHYYTTGCQLRKACRDLVHLANDFKLVLGLANEGGVVWIISVDQPGVELMLMLYSPAALYILYSASLFDLRLSQCVVLIDVTRR